MREDEIVEEVRRTRQAYAARFGHDIAAMAKDLKKAERAHRKRVVSFVRKRTARMPARTVA